MVNDTHTRRKIQYYAETAKHIIKLYLQWQANSNTDTVTMEY